MEGGRLFKRLSFGILWTKVVRICNQAFALAVLALHNPLFYPHNVYLCVSHDAHDKWQFVRRDHSVSCEVRINFLQMSVAL
jgi:hypothetical protein